MKKWKCGVYLRLSKEEFYEDKNSNSIANQKQIINLYIKEDSNLELVNYYIDDGYSGTNFNRPDFKRMLKDLTNGKINTIIVKDLSRFGRNHIEVDNYLENILPMYETRFISINDNIDNYKNPESLDNISVPLKSLMNDLYAKDISNKVKSTLRVKQEKGEFIGSSAPYGYLKDPTDKHKFIIDKEVAYIVKKIFNMILLGKSRKEIANELNSKNILTPSAYKIGNSMNDNKKQWTSEIVNKILRNPTYTGDLIQGIKKKVSYRVNKLVDVNKEDWIIVQNHHEPIINKEEFKKVQDLLNKTNKVNKNNEIDLFAGILICNECDSSFTIKKTKDQIYYYCSNYVRNKECTKHGINKQKLKEKILKEINKKHHEITKLDRKILNDLVDIIYISENKEIKIKFK